MAGYSGKPIAQKLGIKSGFRIFTTGLPGAYSAVIGTLPDEVTIVARPTAPLDMVQQVVRGKQGSAMGWSISRSAPSTTHGRD
jgi:hypothetical protein